MCADELRVALVVPRVDVVSGGMERTLMLLKMGQTVGIDYTAFIPRGGLPNREVEGRLRDLERADRISVRPLRERDRENGHEQFEVVTIPTEYWWGPWKRATAAGLDGPFAFEFFQLPYVGGLDVLKSIGVNDPSAIDLARMPFLIQRAFADGFAPSAFQAAASVVTVRAFAHLADASALALTPVVVKQFAALGYHREMYVPEFPCGIERDLVDEALRADGPIEYDAAYVGRFHPQKGFLDLPLIVHRLKRLLGRDVRVAVCGGTDTERYLVRFRDLARSLGIERNVVLLGRVSRERLYRTIRASRMLLYPSYVDSFSLTILETLCLGVPVVAYGIDAVEMIWSNRTSVHRAPVGRTDAMAEIGASLCDEATGDVARRAAIGQSSGLLREFSWENVIADERRFYEGAARGTGR